MDKALSARYSLKAGDKIRLGYISSDFRDHPVAVLIVEMIERHDRSRFHVTGYSIGPDDNGALGQRLQAGFDKFVDLRSLSTRQAADRINQDGIDILIDLNGYTRFSRPEILAFKPAPIQVNFLGYPGTMGVDYMDYIIADDVCIPPEYDQFYTEKVVRLPDTYQPNDRKRAVSEHTPTRAQCGLPEEGFVFCSFNNSYKITPDFFALWMKLLAKVPGSVLWLLETNPVVGKNLRRVAAVWGIDPDRLVFAPRLPLAEHLARHRLADLFLDTLPYNAHTTTSDALWVGLPVLTCRGETFAGRVAASLLTAMQMPELIVDSIQDYESTALRLATDPALMSAIRSKLQGNLTTAPLFDTETYIKNFEAALLNMLS